MITTFATSAFFPVYSLSPNPGTKSAKFGGSAACFGGIMSKLDSGRLQVKANAQVPFKINGSAVSLTEVKGVKNEEDMPSPAPMTFINLFPDWSMRLAAITTMFLAGEKERMMIDLKPRWPNMFTHRFGLGETVKDSCVSRRNFSIRSYEIGADRTVSLETMMNHLQETVLSHLKNLGLICDGYGASQEMLKRNLIWVVTRKQVVIDRYPTWGDDVQVDFWLSPHGKNCLSGNWIFRDNKTGETLTRASSVWVLMDTKTRRLSKIPEEVRGEFVTYLFDSAPVVDEDNRKLPKLDENTADYILKGLTPKWSDLDLNQHVNNVKYISWILETVPMKILESHELSAMNLEYRRECGRDSVLQSLTAVSSPGVDDLVDSGNIQCHHLLGLEDGTEIMRARTEWRPKHANNIGIGSHIPAESS